MAKAEDTPDLDEFSTPDVDDSENGNDRLDLEPGDSFVGEITSCNLSAGDHGVLEIDGKELWLNATMRRQLEAALVTGEQVAHVKLEDEESFEDGDGEEITYNPRELRFKNDG